MRDAGSMSFSAVVDIVLDRSVIGGYGSPGLSIRRRLPDWPADPPRMDGQTAVVTGATGGLGLAAAEGYARLGAAVRLVGRDEAKTAKAAATLAVAVPGAALTTSLCDVSSLSSLRAFTEAFDGPLDVLVNNAGVMAPKRTLTSDGIETTFATNVIGPFVLTDRLVAHMSNGSRIINVSSGGMYGQRLDGDLQNEHDYKPAKAYARTKRSEVVLTEIWADRLRDRGVHVHSMHPGWAATPGITDSLKVFSKIARPILRTAEQGADTIVWLGSAAEPGSTTGLFWQDRRPRPTHLFGLNKETEADRQRLWDLCVELAGLQDANAA